MSFNKIDGCGRKIDDASILSVEAEKTVTAAAIGHDTGLFYVPKVLSYSAEKGILDTEWIDGLEGLFSVACKRDPKMSELCFRAGAALAAVHKDLRLPEKMRIRLPVKPRARRDEEVFLHGDFNGNNVCYDRKQDRLVIVDWSSAPLLGGKPTFGSRYFDLVWFGHYFFCTRPGLWLGTWNAKTWFQSFVRGYRSIAGSNFSDEGFKELQGELEPFLSTSRRLMLERYFHFKGRYPRLRRMGRYLLLSYGKFHWERCTANCTDS